MSEGTDRPATSHSGADAPAPAGDVEGADLGRRGFFRAFSREAVQTVASFVGVASAVRRGTTAAAGELLGLGLDPAGAADRLAGALGAGGVPFRSPYRLAEGVIHVLDQRRLPAEAVTIPCRTGAEVAGAMRDLATRGAPLLGQLAAYALAMTAERNVASKPFVRNATLRGTANALRNARPDVAAIGRAIDRCVAAWNKVGEPGEGSAIALAIRAEADAIAMEATLGHGRLGREGAALLPQPLDRPLEILTIDETGPLSGGMVGTAMGVVQVVASAGRPVHVWVLETRLGRSGARLATHQLRQSDIPCTVVADAAVGWLLGARQVDAVLVGAERIAANGDVANAVGTYPLAVMAARHGVPFHVCAPLAAVDPAVADGAALTIAFRPAAALLDVGGEPSPDLGTEALVPLDDVTPAELVTSYVTDGGVLGPPFPEPTGAWVA